MKSLRKLLEQAGFEVKAEPKNSVFKQDVCKKCKDKNCKDKHTCKKKKVVLGPGAK